MQLQEIFQSYSTFGFSGSRFSSGVLPPNVLSSAAKSVPKGSRVVIGCQKGVDAFFRQCFPNAEVFSVASGKWGSGKGAYAARSIACIKAVADDSGLWISFPASECPPGLIPSNKSSQCFSGKGSGSWASLAFACGLGVSCLVYSPFGIPDSWNFSHLPDLNKWFSFYQRTSINQLSLF